MLITGDYKFDQTPVDGPPADVARLAQLGAEGLLLLCGDSTNADRPGFSPSERVVGPHLEQVFVRCEGRIVVTCFASNIHRVQQVVDAAALLGRKVALVGRSMRKNIEHRQARSGHIEVPDGILDPAARDRRLPRREARDHLDRVAGRAAQRAAPDGLQRPPAGRAARGRHGRLRRDADPRQRARRQRDDRPPLPHRLRGDHGARRADPRLRPRLRRGDQADAQPHAAALRHAVPRRLQAPRAARRAGGVGRRPGRERLQAARTACRSRSTSAARASASPSAPA